MKSERVTAYQYSIGAIFNCIKIYPIIATGSRFYPFPDII